MKKLIIYSLLVLLWGCKKDNYPGAQISPYVSMFDIRNLYKGQDVSLTMENMFGSDKITGVVVSDHRYGNLPPGLLILQDNRRLSQVRGISIPIGDAAADYLPGDSVIIPVEGKVLSRVNGLLQILGITPADITKVSSGNPIPLNRATTNQILNNPNDYESTLAVVVKGGFDPLPKAGDVLAGNKVLNDGFGDLTLHTASTAVFAEDQLPVSANFYGIVLNSSGPEGQLVPEFRLRKSDDVVVLSSTITIAPVIITGFMSDVKGGDGNYEYVQLMATRDIDFAATPYAVVITNNANASTPAGYPARGWATGSMRTFKFNLGSGTAAKGSFFYVGGAKKMINGPSSTDISNANWIRAFDYTTSNGDGYGNMTGGLFANSGNASGIAVFSDTTVTVNSVPVDVMFIATGGSLYTAGPPPAGYLINNTDFYDIKNPLTLEEQPYYRSGANTLSLAYLTADQGYFNMLGGEYNPALGKWMKARSQTSVLLSKTSAITEIEGEGATQLK